MNGDGDDARRLSIVQPRCRNNSNNSGHEPGKVVANDTTTTTEDDCRPAAPRWMAGVPTGHLAPTQAREECADSDLGVSTRHPGGGRRRGNGHAGARTLRRWRTALDYCGPSMEGQRTRVLTRSPATTQAHEECADSDAPTSRARRRLEEVHQLGHPSPDRKDPRLAQANSTNPSRPLDDAALAPQWMETTNTKAAPTTASLPVRLVSHARDVVRSSLPGRLYAA